MSALTRCLLSFTVVIACALSAYAPAFAGERATSCEPLGHVQKRVVQKARIGVEALRDYVEITRGIHQLDMATIATSLDTWVAQARCAGIVMNDDAVREVVAVASTTR